MRRRVRYNRVKGYKCLPLYQTVQRNCRLHEWRKDPLTGRPSAGLIRSSLVLLEIFNCWKSGITLVRVKIVQVKSGCKMDKWRRDPLTLRQLYATRKSAHWKPLAAVFRETFCITSSRRPRNSLQQRPEGWRSSQRQQENAGNSVVMICRIFRIWQVWHGIGHNFVWWR